MWRWLKKHLRYNGKSYVVPSLIPVYVIPLSTAPYTVQFKSPFKPFSRKVAGAKNIVAYIEFLKTLTFRDLMKHVFLKPKN